MPGLGAGGWVIITSPHLDRPLGPRQQSFKEICQMSIAHQAFRRRRNRGRPDLRRRGRVARRARLRGLVYPAQRGFVRRAGFYGRYNVPGGESKFHDVDLDDAVVASAGTITATVNIIPQGVTEITRVGRKCTITSINWRWQLSLPETDAGATPSAGDICRIIMYLDKQANGAAAAVTDVLESAALLSYNNLANSQRFLTLMDRNITINYNALASDNAAVVSSPNVVKYGKFYKRCNIPIEFNSTTGAIGEIRSNNIGVLMISQAGQPGFVSKIRLRFKG